MEKMIGNPSQAFSLGATWGTPSVDNAMTTEQCDLINATGLTLYTGDIVALDPTGTMAVQLTTATLNCAIGCVGSTLEASEYPAVESIAGANVTNTFPTIAGSTGGVGISSLAFDGNSGVSPAAWQSLSLGFTNGSAAITSASTATINPLFVGAFVYTPYNATTNATPQVFQVISNGGTSGSWTAVGAVIAGAGTTFSGTTGSFVSQVGRDFGADGPGWYPPLNGQWTNTTASAPGAIVPIVMRGFGRVNVSGLTTLIRGSFVIGTNASFAGTLVLITALTAAQAGFVIATALEPYAQRDTYLTTVAGITGHDSVRAIIGKM